MKRIGHGGTLDPAVTGVLPIALGKATKLLSFLPSSKKYEGTIKLGIITDTDDLEGEIIKEHPLPNIDEKIICECINSFQGVLQQRPPRFSSVHINGERAYRKARRGEQFELPSKEITIHKLELIEWDQENGKIKLKIDCSAGTYIRSLARDIGEELGCGGALLKLRRTEALGFNIKDSLPLKDFEDNFPYINSHLVNPLKVLNHLPKIQLTLEEETLYWCTGRALIVNKERILIEKSNINNQLEFPNDLIIVINNKGILVGVGRFNCDPFTINPKIVFNAKG